MCLQLMKLKSTKSQLKIHRQKHFQNLVNLYYCLKLNKRHEMGLMERKVCSYELNGNLQQKC